MTELSYIFYAGIRKYGVQGVLHRFAYPTLDSFSQFTVDCEPEQVLKEVSNSDAIPSISKLRQEFVNVQSGLSQRYKESKLEYPSWFAIESSTSFLLYSLVRILKPLNAVETGVANGHSSFVILSALEANGSGALHSFDLTENVGNLVTEEQRERWDLIVLPERGRNKAFSRSIERLKGIDFFLHDSNHLYYWQKLEYEVAWSNMNEGGILMSDDVDSSFAFLDFCKEKKLRPVFLFDKRKMVGLTRKPAVKETT